MASRTPLVALAARDLANVVVSMGEKPFRAAQIAQWIFRKGVADWGDMRTVPAELRRRLAEQHTVDGVCIQSEQISADGTRKWLMRTGGGSDVETVFIPEATRGTLCVSSQVGCSLSCSFCHTGTQPLEGNLAASDIVGQVLHAGRALGDFPRQTNTRPAISNVVFMGQGEPLFNYRAVRAAVRTLTDPDRLAIPRRRVTVSTSGVAPLIPRLASELGIRLAISLHAPRDDLRTQIMAINRTYPLPVLLDACRRYDSAAAASAPNERDRRITFEYLMLKDVNDSPSLAHDLADLVAGLPAHVNLIPFNTWPGAEYTCSGPAVIDAFKRVLHRRGVFASVRAPRGDDILAACGQLRSANAAEGEATGPGQLSSPLHRHASASVETRQGRSRPF